MSRFGSLVALVTGGGSGLGREVCRQLSIGGARVVSLDLKPSDESDVTHIAGQSLNSLSIVVSRDLSSGDIRKTEDVKRALDVCGSRVDLLLNCAGISNAFKTYNFENSRPQRLQDMTEQMFVNVLGTFNVIRLTAPLLNNGLIVLTSSILATDGHEGQTGYAASQMAIQSMTLPLARDLSTNNTRVVCLSLGFFDTPLVSRSNSPELLDYICMTTPCPSRLFTTLEFSNIIESLLTNPILNGCVIRVDGANRWPERG